MIAIAVAALVVGLTAFTTMAVKDRTYVTSPRYSPVGEPSSDVAVIYYSRSGHSEAVAREIARRFNASTARIEANYSLDFQGQGRAISDARADARPPISVEPINLRSAKRVYLVSPTWMFRPAPPLWSYVAQTDLNGKEVVLVMTGNSRFEQEQIDAFGALILTRGGRLIHQMFLRRGRVYWQQTREQTLAQLNTRLDAIQ